MGNPFLAITRVSQGDDPHCRHPVIQYVVEEAVESGMPTS